MFLVVFLLVFSELAEEVRVMKGCINEVINVVTSVSIRVGKFGAKGPYREQSGRRLVIYNVCQSLKEVRVVF